MRDIFLVIAVLAGLGVTFAYPFVGLLLWEWFSLMQPHEQAFGFSRTLPLNLAIAVVTITSWLLSKESKRLPRHSILILLGLFLLWMTFNSFFAFSPDWSWPFWDRTWRILVIGFMVAIMATNRVRIEAIIWVAAISLLYYGVRGGVFTILTGGTYKVYGPDNTIISDNNQLALALLMALPLMEYLRAVTTSKLLSWFLIACMALTAVSVLGSYSRGAYIAMAAIAVFAWLRAKRKILYIVVVAMVIVPALYFMPQSFYDRVNTLNDASSDASLHGRLVAWQVAIKYATDHFPFGAGFYGPQLKGVFNSYFPDEVAHAAHSIYFQVLGEHGYIGLVIYLLLGFISLASCSRTARKASKDGTVWLHKLSLMIQISLMSFFVGGAALSMAYYDLYIILICLLPRLALLAGVTKPARAFRVGSVHSGVDLQTGQHHPTATTAAEVAPNWSR